MGREDEVGEGTIVSVYTECEIMDIDAIIAKLDNMNQEDISRLKVVTSDEISEGTMSQKKHHGRCDIGSPFASGEL